MVYNSQYIANLNQTVDKYVFFKLYGHGVIESRFKQGSIVEIRICSELDAFILTEAINISIHGIISNRTSWEEYIISFKKYKSGDVYDTKVLD